MGIHGGKSIEETAAVDMNEVSNTYVANNILNICLSAGRDV